MDDRSKAHNTIRDTQVDGREAEVRMLDMLWVSGLQRFYHQAMATTFEVVIVHKDARYAGQAARAAFDEADRLEAELSRFIENSDISRINNLPANQALRLGLSAFDCLQISCRICAETNGAFDVTVSPLLDCWHARDETPRKPSKEQLRFAREHTGMHLLKLVEPEHTVELLASPVQIDLGGIGKGYAVDRMAELLREWSINSALISGGYSSVLAVGSPPATPASCLRKTGSGGWPLTLSNPANPKQTLARLYFQNKALSASGLRKGQHIIDPRSAQPVEGRLAAWASAADAATADALSTAFMIMAPEEIENYCLHHPDVLGMVILQGGKKDIKKDKVLLFGRWEEDELLI
jgi:thiamine biosynthesis lipoprotein